MRFTHKTSNVGTPCQYNSWGKDKTHKHMLYAVYSRTEQRCRATAIHKCVSIKCQSSTVHRCVPVQPTHLLAMSLSVLATSWILGREIRALWKGKQVSSRVFWTERGRQWKDELPLDKSQPTLPYFHSCQPPTLTFCLLFCLVLVISTLSLFISYLCSVSLCKVNEKCFPFSLRSFTSLGVVQLAKLQYILCISFGFCSKL